MHIKLVVDHVKSSVCITRNEVRSGVEPEKYQDRMMSLPDCASWHRGRKVSLTESAVTENNQPQQLQNLILRDAWMRSRPCHPVVPWQVQNAGNLRENRIILN
jgi:hypothetical protein